MGSMYEKMLRNWVKTLSNDDFTKYVKTVLDGIEEEKVKRGLK